ncbi:MAG: phosphocarrier protein HPr [Candidatus Sedimenticola endophacoides]|uniref:HPr family phosphocarrier protein n=1 Tax=Candidatus Sedimenticola endophacoides TaxID=2548426 RepID=A0A657PIT0_9GAMM|nr:MAG: phosphocarrier protein HPr [Candidatus Sedimenticola endophacoides]OQX32562.1 MAG: phosphocarrier protein HPr [Candidatus Sedimenticola endophacoides]OQX35655.1 MAG: phosphocarrier protein HPr [Candidatus Sedimenticola endophacoides]OQX40442.1 MAG: phosphocarrier protein HPr [Candidatus Sedimenticola endophacoides]OQX42396.1 MAG: phosphocarrier protein HPr [Candidatus Sedimenticola endophacoides]
MLQQQIEIINKLGLHARAAAKLVSLASQFASDILLTHQGREVNAKSIMGVMMLAACQGTVLTLRIDGPDEQAALEAVISLFGDYFGEGE